MNLFSSKKSLSDVILGYRKPNTNHKQYLNQILSDTKQELTTKDFGDKAVAAQKLLFLFNEGIDISWAIFNIIELMGSNSFENKRISYVLAPIVLRDGQNQEFLTLTPNIFRKDFKDMGQDPFTVSISVNCLARICDQDLAQILYREMIPLYTCSKALIRRKICILTYKMFYFCTDSIPELLPYLSDRLKDTKTGVQISAVTTIHEISRLNPKLFLVTIPHLFELLNNTKSNWLIIKLIKLFVDFLPVEPRLFNKLRPKFRELLINQKAKSVEYELIKAIIQNFKSEEDIELVLLAKEKLGTFLSSKDPNLQCFNSEDPSIKNRALEIIKVTTMKENLESLVNEMLQNLNSFRDPNFQRNVMSTILDICTSNNYQNVSNFEWLSCQVLFTLAKQVSGLINQNQAIFNNQSSHETFESRQDFDTKFERQLGETLIDIAMKVEDVRSQQIVKKCYETLTDKNECQSLIFQIRGVKQSQFLQSILFILSEYLGELNFSDQQQYQLAKFLVDSEDLNKKVLESIRLQIINIIFKAALKNQDSSLDYQKLLTEMKPSGFDSFELKDQIQLYYNILKLKQNPNLPQEAGDIISEIIDDELSQFNEQAQMAVPIPDCLNEKFMVSKKEVQVQEKFLIGNQSQMIRQKTVKQDYVEKSQQNQNGNSNIITPKQMLENCFEEQKQL